MICTVVSTVPFAIEENKPGLYPGYFTIPAAQKDDIEVLVVDKAVSYLYLDHERGSAPIHHPGEEVAAALCRDYINGNLRIVSEEAEPGIFFVTEALTRLKDEPESVYLSRVKADIKKKYATRIQEALRRQKNWFIQLVEFADDEWNKFHNHKMISDLQRYACDYLGLTREWNVKGESLGNVFCPACQSTISKDAIVCPQCRVVVKPEEYKAKKFETVGA